MEPWAQYLVITELSEKVPGFVKVKIPKPLFMCCLIHLIPSVTEVHAAGRASSSRTDRIDLSYLGKGEGLHRELSGKARGMQEPKAS